MAIPFASAYQPINLLNDAIQNQAARQQQGYLQASALNDASVADSLNRIVQQKALEQQSRDRQQHYGLQREQLAGDLAYRNAALREAELRSIEQSRQFDRVQKLNEQIAKAQIERPQIPPTALAALGQRDAFNSEALGIAGELNLAFKTAKAKRDAALQEILEVQKSNSPGAIWKDIWTSDLAWAKQARAIDAGYRDEISKIAQAAQGKVSIRNASPDDYEAVPLTLPQLNFPGMMQPQPQAAPQGVVQPELPDAGPYPAAWGRPAQAAPVAAVPVGLLNRPTPAPAPLFNPYAAFSAMRQQQGQPSIRTNAPPSVVAGPVVQPIPAAQANVEGVHYRRNADGTTTILVPIITPLGRVIPAGMTGTFGN